MNPPRIAFFTDSYTEANGVARTAKALEAYASRRSLPFLCVHGGPQTSTSSDGGQLRMQLGRGRASFSLEHDLKFDPLLWRHLRTVAAALREFRPDVLHFTGPSDVGQLGAYLGHRMRIPMVGSWHTNLHEYASRRGLKHATWLSDSTRLRLRYAVERHALSATLQFYRLPRVVLAPNEEFVDLLSRRTGKPTFLMSRGVDIGAFTPARRVRRDGPLNLGFVGRLSPEKSVRMLPLVERALADAGIVDFRFTIIGEGAERPWLQRNMTRATFLGVLRGGALADAYADMDLFVFPSQTETVGNVVLEAMASGVAIVAMGQGGPRYTVDHGVNGMLADTDAEFIAHTIALARDPGARAALAARGRGRALERSWDAIFDDVYRAYAIAASDDLWRAASAGGRGIEPIAERQPTA